MTAIEVLIAGAGPTGLVLALWLARQGVAVRIIDRTAPRTQPPSRVTSAGVRCARKRRGGDSAPTAGASRRHALAARGVRF